MGNMIAAPFPLGTVLDAAQGGTSLDLSESKTGQYLTTTGNPQAPLQLTTIPAAPSAKQSAVFTQQFASGTGAAVGNANDFNKRAMNTTVVNSIVGCSLAAGDVTLPAGTYHITAYAVCCQYAATQISINSDISTLAVINGASVNGPTQTTLTGMVEGILTLATPTPIYISQFNGATVAGGTLSLGNPVSSGAPEIYAQINIIQL